MPSNQLYNQKNYIIRKTLNIKLNSTSICVIKGLLGLQARKAL